MLKKDVTFLAKSYGECIKVEKPALVPASYEGSDAEKGEMVSGYNEKNSNNHNVLSISNSDDSNYENGNEPYKKNSMT